MRHLLSIFLLATALSGFTQGLQELQIGQWREHLPYNQVHSVAESDELIFAATSYAVFTFNKTTQEVERLSKINGLSGTDITSITHFSAYDYTIVGYNNGDLDLIQGDLITNISDIKNSSLVADKRIIKILEFDSTLYLCTGFGVVLMDPITWEFTDKYTMPSNGTFTEVLDLDRDSTHWYAGLGVGLYKAPREGKNLSDFKSWNQQFKMVHPWAAYRDLAYINDTMYISCVYKWDPDTIYYNTPETGWVSVEGAPSYDNHRFMEYQDNRVFVGTADTIMVYDNRFNAIDSVVPSNYGGEVNPFDVIVGQNGLLYIADNDFGLVSKDLEKEFWKRIAPEGPSTNEIFEIVAGNGHAYFSHGARTRTNGNNSYKTFSPNHLYQGDWEVIAEGDEALSLSTVRDIVALKMDPNDPEHVYMASMNRGIVEVKNQEVVEIYDDSNSSLTRFVFDSTFSLMSAVDIQYDYQGNLWFAVSNVEEALTVLTTSGDWHTYSLPGIHSGRRVDHLMVDQFGNKWVSQTESAGGGMIVYNEQGTFNTVGDDLSTTLTSTAGEGNLPSNGITAIVEDLDGEVWIGTTAGLGVVFAPSQIFSGAQAQQLLIQQDGYTEYLLEGQEISAIAVDGANQKWIGTTTSGLFLINEDGTEELAHFTSDNSGLFSDAITSIAVDHSTGEVYVGTGNGLVSYMGVATAGGYTLDNVSAFPNPVPPGYTGNIVVDGLMLDTEVTITDAAGNYVNQMNSVGGRMVWDGRDVNGERVHTGVYLLMGISADGSQRMVSKIAFIH